MKRRTALRRGQNSTATTQATARISSVWPRNYANQSPSWLRSLILILPFSCCTLLCVFGQPTTFSYQGRLAEGTNAATGHYDLQFSLYEAITGGNTVSAPVNVPGTPVTEGLFTVVLDFGPAAFDGSLRFLEMAVRPAGSTNAFVTLAPRQLINSAPYAMQAGTASALRGTLADSQLSGNIPRLNGTNVFTGPVSFLPDSGAAFSVSSEKKIQNLNADKLDSLDSTAFWKTFGNSGTSPSTNFLGTLDSQPLDFRVNGLSAVTIGTNGNVGIGTANPQAKLDIANGSVAVSLSPSFRADGGLSGDNYPNGLSTTWHTTGDTGWADTYGTVFSVKNHGTRMFQFDVSPDDPANGTYMRSFYSPNWSPFRKVHVEGTNGVQGNALFAGNVGIGTTGPNGKLEIYRNDAATSDNDNRSLFLHNAGTGDVMIGFLGKSDTLGMGIGLDSSNDAMVINAHSRSLDISPLVTIKETGNVGIGTTTPGAALEVAHPSGSLLRLNRNDGTGFFGLNVSSVMSGSSADFFVTPGQSNSGVVFRTRDANNTVINALGIDRNGRVGIGTTAPEALLEVVRGSDGVPFDVVKTGGSGPIFRVFSDVPKTDAQLALAVLRGGNVGIGTASPQAKLDVVGTLQLSGGELWTDSHWAVRLKSPISSVWRTTAPDLGGKYLGFGMTDAGWYFIRSAAADDSASAEYPLAILYNGSVGIGTTSPNEALHVMGNIIAEGTAGNGRVIIKGTGGGGHQYEWYPDSPAIGDLGLFDRTAAIFPLVVKPSGRIGIGTPSPVSALEVAGTVTATAFNPPSDRNLKENFTEVSPVEVLEKVATLPMSRWNFKGDASTPHLGPMAQDFHAAFGLGTDDKHIATVDADGVALAAIQGLNQKLEAEVKAKDSEIQALKGNSLALEERVAQLERIVLALGNK